MGLRRIENLLEGGALIISTLNSTDFSLPDEKGFRKTYLSKYDFQKIGIKFKTNWEAKSVSDAFSEANIDPLKAEIIFVLEDRQMKLRKVIARQLASEIPKEIPLLLHTTDQFSYLINDVKGFEIHSEIVLIEDIEFLPGRPYRKGTKLAKTSFRFTVESDGKGLNPKALSEDKCQEFGLPVSTLTYLHLIEPGVWQASDLQESVEFYINELVLKELGQSSNQSEHIQKLLAVQFFQQLIYIISSELKQEMSENPGFTTRSDFDDFPVLRMIVKALMQIRNFDKPNFIRDLIEKPEKLCGLISGLDGLSRDLVINLVGPIAES